MSICEIVFNTISLYSKSKCNCQSADHNKVVTSSNSAYGVVSASEDHEYELIELPQMDTQHLSTTGQLVTH